MPPIPLELLLHTASYLRDDVLTFSRLASTCHALHTILAPEIFKMKVYYAVGTTLVRRDLVSLSYTCRSLRNVLAPLVNEYNASDLFIENLVMSHMMRKRKRRRVKGEGWARVALEETREWEDLVRRIESRRRKLWGHLWDEEPLYCGDDGNNVWTEGI